MHSENHRLTPSHWQLPHITQVVFKPGECAFDWLITAMVGWPNSHGTNHRNLPQPSLDNHLTIFSFIAAVPGDVKSISCVTNDKRTSTKVLVTFDPSQNKRQGATKLMQFDISHEMYLGG